MHGKPSFPSTRHRHRTTGTAQRGLAPLCRFAPALACLLAVAAPASARDAPTWNLDPVHTRVMFALSHAGFSQALGTVSGSTGTLVFDPDDWQRTRLQASVPLARADLGDPDWNRAVLAPRLLDVEAYPTATFTSDSAVASDSGGIRVCGELSLHGVTRPLCMDVTVNAVRRHPMPPFRRTAGFSATAVLSRSDFGITAWPSVIGDEVTIRIEAEAVRSRAAERPPEPESPSEPEPRPQPQLTPEPESESEPGGLQ